MTTELVTTPIAQELATQIEQYGLAPKSATDIANAYAPFARQARDLIEKCAPLAKIEVPTLADIKMASTARKLLRDVRVDADKARKKMKEDSLRMGKAIDGMNNWLLLLIEPVENRLGEIEKYAEIQEQKRQDALKAERTVLLQALNVDPTPYLLGQMTPEQWEPLYAGLKKADEDKKAAAAKAESDRLAAIEAVRIEQERIKAENERLRKETEAKEAQLRAERAEAEAKLAEERRKAEAARVQAENKARAEREAAAKKAAAEKAAADEVARKERIAREAAEAEIKRVKADADAKAKADAEAARKAAAAPLREKLTAYRNQIAQLKWPELPQDKNSIIAPAHDTYVATIDQIILAL